MDLFPHEKKHLELLKPYLSECTLFLSRDDSFPISSPCEVLLYGNGVRNTVKGGTGSGEVNSRFFDNIEEAFEKNDFTIKNKEWLDKYDEIRQKARKSWIKRMKKEAKEHHVFAPIYCMGAIQEECEYDLPLMSNAPLAVYVLSRICGEGSDRKVIKGDILLTDTEIKNILYLNEHIKNFLLVLNVGGMIDLSPIKEVRNVLLLSQLGVETSQTLLDIILGKTNPSGKLTFSWNDISSYPYKKISPIDDTIYQEGKYVGYRYFSSKGIKPLFPFGYGLSYSSFECKVQNITHEKDTISVAVSVKNISSIPGKEVIQCYLSSPSNVYQDLVAFKKSKLLMEKEEEILSLSFKISDFAIYDEERELYYLPKGTYYLRVGNSSEHNSVVGKLVLKEEIITRESKNIFDKVHIDNELHLNIHHEEINCLTIYLNSDDFSKKKIIHQDDFIDEEVKKLSDEELALLCCGNFKNIPSMVGNNSTHVVGAAGEICSLYKKLFNRQLIMSDGPAGIRIDSKCFIDKKGNRYSLMNNNIENEILEFMSPPLRLLAKKFYFKHKKAKKNDEIYYQYCTAIPIGTALAQSWNLDFAYLCGDIIGREMEIYNIDLWLAPALNIQRTILCGRNFEYYSEDPLISGLFASYISLGVKSHPNKEVVIKHFAANNQEVNRYQNNSIVSEKTFREIYLRGFEICINNAKPRGIMTSYNLVNGIHTSENTILINSYLYDELRYQGIVMTDWIIENAKNKKVKHPFASSDRIMKTKTSLVMPGCKKNVDDILIALKEDKLSREELERNVSLLLKTFK